MLILNPYLSSYIWDDTYNKCYQAEGKKMRDDKEKVMEILFSLFEKHQYYNIKVKPSETK